MSNYDQLRLYIQNSIKGNGNREITGFLLQDVLLYMVDELSEGVSGGATSNAKLFDGQPSSYYAKASELNSLTSDVSILKKLWSLENGVLKTDYPIMARGYAAGATATVEEGGGSGAILNKESIIAALGYTPYDSANPKGYITVSALTGYATQDYVSQQISNIDLSPYAKTADVAATYVAKDLFFTHLSSVDNRLGTLESYFATSDDADAQINKWNEIVSFLDATEGTTLAGILAAYTLKSDFNSAVSTIDSRLTSLEDMWYIEDGVLKTRYPILSKGYAAGAVATVGEGGGGAILNKESIIAALGYTPYDSANPNEYITTSALSGYQLSSGLGSLAYKSSLVASDIPDLSGKYLPLTGGNINGTLAMVSGSKIQFYTPSSVFAGTLGADSDKNLFWYNNGAYNTLLHSGNICSYTAGDSLKLDGVSPSLYLRKDENLVSNVDVNELKGMRFYVNTMGNGSGNTNTPASYGYLLSLCDAAASDAVYYKGVQISFGGGNVLQFRWHWEYAWRPWKTIAFTDSDITGYAAGLKHSNGTVAAEVNSNGSIGFSGHLNIGTKAICGVSAKPIIQQESSGHLFVGYGSSGLGYNTYFCGNEVHLRYSKDSYTGLILNSSGNVTIGGSDLAGSDYRLFVNGVARVNGCIELKNTSSNYGYIRIENHRIGSGGHSDGLIRMYDTNGNSYGGIGVYGDTAPRFYYFGFGGYNTGTELRVYATGNVTVGSSDNGYKFQVNGTGKFDGAVTMASTLTVGGDITPSAAGTYNLGGNSARWKNIYANTVDTVNVDASGYVYAVGNIHSDEYLSTDGYIKIGDATISYVNGVLKVDKPFMAKGYAAGATASVSSGEGGVILNKENIIDALGYTPYDAANPSNYTTRSAIFTGSASQFLKADGSVDSTAYLSTAGGTITGSLKHKVVASGGDATGFNYEGSSGRIAGIGGYALNGNLEYIYLGWGTSPWLESNCLAISSERLAYKGKDILHSSNVGEYATKGLNIQTSSDNTRSLFSVWRGNTDTDGDGYVMDFNWNSGNYKAQIYIDVDPTHKMALRQCGNSGTWNDWKTIAFTDSNVASATKLQTARTIWGRSFDGTADVSDSLTIYKNSSDYTANWARHTHVRDSANTILSAFGFYGEGDTLLYTYIGPSYASPLVSIRPSGNVGIGVAYPAYKLDVAGTARISGAVTVASTLTVGGNITPSAHNAYSLGTYGKAFGNAHINTISSGAENNNLWIVGGSKTDSTAIIFARNATGLPSNSVGRWNAIGLRPDVTNTVALGTSDYRWSTIYGVNGDFSGALTVTGATTLADTLTARHIYPNANNTYNLGDTQLRWKNLYCNLVYATGIDADALYIYNSIYSEGDIYSEVSLTTDGAVRAGGFLETDSGVKINTISLLYNAGAMSINASIEPASTMNYNLGTPTKLWAGIYSNSIQTNTIKIGDATISYENGVLKIDKPIMATGYAAGATATAN